MKIRFTQITKTLALVLIIFITLGFAPSLSGEVVAKTSNNPSERLDQWMEEARQAMAKEKYRRAVALYTRILEFPENNHSQNALEYLGLARERLNQNAHAISTYKKYLSIYPSGENANRIKQRLSTMMTATNRPRKKLRKSKTAKKITDWKIYGNISQYYRRNETTTENESAVNYSAINSGVNFIARKRSKKFDMRSRLTASYEYGLLDDDEKEPIRISSLYFDAVLHRPGVSGRIGRQRNNRGGVIGRFDGVTLGYQTTPQYKINFITGFPVNIQKMDEINTDKIFYGINADLGLYDKAWNPSFFMIEQRISGFTDRRSIGMELRYFKMQKSLTTLIDYDIFFKELNMFLVFAHWTFPTKTRLDATLDFRKSPLLTTSNALIGQKSENISELKNTYSMDEINRLARDRTSNSRTATIGISHPLNKKYLVGGNITTTKISSTPASGGIEAMPETDADFFYTLQFSGTSLWQTGDFTMFTARYSDASNASTRSLLASSRFPVKNGWRINPRIRIDFRKYTNNNRQQRTMSPSFRSTYRWRKRYNFDGELGKNWTVQQLESGDQKYSSFYINAGVRIDF